MSENEKLPLIKMQATLWTSGKGARTVEESVLMERLFTLSVNGCQVVQEAYTPGDLRELAVGRLLTLGYIRGRGDILSMRVEEGAGCVAAALLEPARPRRNLRPLPQVRWDPEVLMSHARDFLTRSELFQATGNVHSAMITRGEEALLFAEDMSRHNAVDKALGKADLQDLDLSECALFTSGRIPSEIVLKAIRAGVPIVVSRSAPTDSALSLARHYGLQVIGFSRGDRMTAYPMSLKDLSSLPEE